MNLAELYQGAGRLVNLVAANEVLTSEDLDIAKECLSLLLSTWSVNPALQWSRTVLELPTDGSSASVTLPQRPVAIHQAQWSYGGNSATGVKWNLQSITEEDYYSIQFRNITAPPSKFLWDKNKTVTMFPTPSSGVVTLVLQMPLIQDVNDLTTELALPPGYEMAIKYSLASLLAQEYGKNDDGLGEKASSLVALIQVQGLRVPIIQSHSARLFGHGSHGAYVPLINKP